MSAVTDAVIRGLGAALVPLVITILARLRNVRQRGTLEYPRAFRTFALVMVVVPTLITEALALLSARDTQAMLGALGFLALWLVITAPLALETLRVRYTLDLEGIHVRSPWSRNRSIAWRDIDQIRWRQGFKWLDLRAGKSVVHISPLLAGLDELSEACNTHLDGELLKADPEAWAALQLMAEGQAVQLGLQHVRPSKLLAARR